MRRRLNLDLVAVIAIGTAGIVWFNALWLQDGRHPAPLFTAPGPQIDASRASDQAASLTRNQAAHMRTLQHGLHELGFYYGPIDGLNGPRTRSAVSAYRKAHGLGDSGVADERLLWHVRAVSRDIPSVVPPVSPETSPRQQADKRILAVQKVLADLGYAPGKVDGRLGEQTRSAISRFEHDYGLKATGQISTALMRKLSAVSGVALKDTAGL